MRVKILGCSGGIGPGLRTTSLLVDDALLIDAGTGVGDLSLAAQRRVQRVFLTHAHLDHVCGLAFMVDNVFALDGPGIDVYATDATRDALRAHLFNWHVWPDFAVLPCAENGMMRWNDVCPGDVFPQQGFNVVPFEVLHTVPAIGYALQTPRSTFAFTGDAYAHDAMWNALNALPRLDKLMIEVAFADEQAALGYAAKHFTPALLGDELKKLRHHPKLYLTHHKPGASRVIQRQCKAALKGWDYTHLKRGDVISVD